MIDPIFNMYKIKFSVLDNILSGKCDDIDETSEINLYINLECILNILCNERIEKYLRIRTKEKITEMMANILNLISHYRLYFSKNKLFSKIFIYVSYPFNMKQKNCNIIESYREHYNYKFGVNINNYAINQVLNESIKLVSIICHYIPNVYVIHSGSIESSLVPYIVNDTGSKNFILSKDIYDYQYVNMDYRILRPKRDDLSYLIHKENVIETLKKEFRIKNNTTIKSEYLTFILSLLGSTRRCIPKIKKIGLGGIIKFIDDAINTNKISSNIYNINILCNLIKEDYRETLLNNFYCTDLETQYRILNAKDKYSINEQLQDKFDNNGLKKVNSMFDTNPIQLMEIMSGDRFKK